MADNLEFEPRQGQIIFFLLQNVQNRYGAQPAFFSLGTRCSFLAIKRPERGVDHSPPSSAEVKNEYSNTPTRPVCLQGGDEKILL